MGMYDTVKVPCPKCSGHAFVQVKSGPQELELYDYGDCPDDVRADLIDEPCQCELGHKFVIRGEVRVTTRVEAVSKWPKDVDTWFVWGRHQ